MKTKRQRQAPVLYWIGIGALAVFALMGDPHAGIAIVILMMMDLR